MYGLIAHLLLVLVVLHSPEYGIVVVHGLSFDQLIRSLTDDISPIRLFHKQLTDIYNSTSLCTSSSSNCQSSNSIVDYMKQCIGNNYDQCKSQYPNPYCLETIAGGESTDCMKVSSACSTILDYTRSTVRIPGSLDISFKSDDKLRNDGEFDIISIIEGICNTIQLDNWFPNIVMTDEVYNERNSNTDRPRPLQIHYGTKDGIHRIFPGRASTESNCPFRYDPRLRPWYTASSTGRKNIIILLDISKTISEGNRLTLMKDASEYIINSTNIADKITVIAFSNTTINIVDMDDDDMNENTNNKHQFYQSSDMNQNVLREALRKLNVDDNIRLDVNTPNYTNALNHIVSFIIESRTINDIYCNNTAILLFTDSAGTKIASALSAIQQLYNNNQTSSLSIFGYIVTDFDDVTQYDFPCNRYESGVWATMKASFNPYSSHVDIFRNFFEYYEYGLSSIQDTDIPTTIWVEPYKFFSFGINGTSVSMPLYDPRYPTSNRKIIGVLAVDYSISDLVEFSDVTLDKVIDKIDEKAKEAQDKKCPIMKTIEGNPIRPYDLQYYSIPTYSKYALCSNPVSSTSGSSNTIISNNTTSNATGTDANSTESGNSSSLNDNNADVINTTTPTIGSCQDCQEINTYFFVNDFYLNSIWNNTNYSDIDYIDRGCCVVDGGVCTISEAASAPSSAAINATPPTTPSNNESLSGGAIAGIVIGCLVFVAAGVVVAGRMLGRSSNDEVANIIKPTGWTAPPSNVPSAPYMDD